MNELFMSILLTVCGNGTTADVEKAICIRDMIQCREQIQDSNSITKEDDLVNVCIGDVYLGYFNFNKEE